MPSWTKESFRTSFIYKWLQGTVSSGSSDGDVHLATVYHEEDAAYWKAEAARLQDALQDFQKRVNDLETRLQEEIRAQNKLEKRYRKMRESLKRNQSEVETLSLEYQALSQKLEEAERLSESRRKELKSAEPFINIQDKMSGKEIIQVVRDFNLQIVAVATDIADSVDPHTRSMNELSKLASSIDVMGSLPEPVAVQLATRDHSKDRTILQIVIQSILIWHTAYLFSCFCHYVPRDVDRWLLHIHRQLSESEHQGVAARWRSLTYSKLAPLRNGKTVHTAVYNVVKDIAEALMRSGCSSAKDISLRSIMGRFGPQVATLVEDASSTIDVLREKIISTDFYIMAPQCMEVFNPQSMDSAIPGSPTMGQVFCTTALGLGHTRKTTKSQSSGPIIENRILLKPKVMLGSAFQLLDAA